MKYYMERKLLYFESSIQLPMNWHGEPIYKSVFKDVKTGDQIILNSCLFSQDISKIFGEHYYSAITDAEKDFDILWKVSDDEVRSVDDEFIHVQGIYEEMLRNGVSLKDINGAMIDYYSSLKIAYQFKAKLTY